MIYVSFRHPPNAHLPIIVTGRVCPDEYIIRAETVIPSIMLEPSTGRRSLHSTMMTNLQFLLADGPSIPESFE